MKRAGILVLLVGCAGDAFEASRSALVATPLAGAGGGDNQGGGGGDDGGGGGSEAGAGGATSAGQQGVAGSGASGPGDGGEGGAPGGGGTGSDAGSSGGSGGSGGDPCSTCPPLAACTAGQCDEGAWSSEGTVTVRFLSLDTTGTPCGAEPLKVIVTYAGVPFTRYCTGPACELTGPIVPNVPLGALLGGSLALRVEATGKGLCFAGPVVPPADRTLAPVAGLLQGGAFTYQIEPQP